MSKIYTCETTSYKNSTSQLDFKKNFKLELPTNWKTNLYYDDYKSEIFTADTTKQLSESFILGASFNFGVLEFDDSFYKRTDSILAVSALKIMNSGNQLFQKKPSYWYVVKGTKNGFPYHQLNLTVINSTNTYFNAYSEIYGEDTINERICEAISIIEKVEFVK